MVSSAEGNVVLDQELTKKCLCPDHIQILLLDFYRICEKCRNFSCLEFTAVYVALGPHVSLDVVHPSMRNNEICCAHGASNVMLTKC